jgi:hypothetical protein
VEDLVRLLVTGLVVAAILVPIVRWFWSRFDRPTEAQIAYEEERARQKQEARMWAQIEAKMRADEAAAEEAAAEARYRLELEARAKGADRTQISGAISALGSEQLQPVLRDVKESRPAPKATVGAEAAVVDGDALFSQEPDDADLRVDGPAQVSLEQDRAGAPAPDWELIERLRALKERTEDSVDAAMLDPHPDVPSMPDLPSLDDAEAGAAHDDSTEKPESEDVAAPFEPAMEGSGDASATDDDPPPEATEAMTDEGVEADEAQDAPDEGDESGESFHEPPSGAEGDEANPPTIAQPTTFVEEVDTAWDEASTGSDDDGWDVEW